MFFLRHQQSPRPPYQRAVFTENIKAVYKERGEEGKHVIK